jgi:hypothetical protein
VPNLLTISALVLTLAQHRQGFVFARPPSNEVSE